MTAIDRSRRIIFEQVADLYNQTRPEYPDQLAGDVIRLSSLPPDGRILEIGCGAGNATIAFARRGYSLLGIELGAKLAAYARRRCQSFPNAVIVQAAFEDYQSPVHSFDLALSADAFHWIQPEIGYPKLMRALKQTGSLALIWQVVVDPQTGWSRAIDEAFSRRAPEFESPHHTFTHAWLVNVILENFRDYCGIDAVTVRTYPWSERIDADKFIKLLRTASDLYDIDAPRWQLLADDIRRVFDGCGGWVDKPYQAVLFHAQVKDQVTGQ